jgi:hypothetical protein
VSVAGVLGSSCAGSAQVGTLTVGLFGFHAGPVPSDGLLTRTRERYATVQELLSGGESLSAICRILSLDRKTVQRFARAGTVEQLLGKAIARTSLLDPFKPKLNDHDLGPTIVAKSPNGPD